MQKYFVSLAIINLVILTIILHYPILTILPWDSKYYMWWILAKRVSICFKVQLFDTLKQRILQSCCCWVYIKLGGFNWSVGSLVSLQFVTLPVFTHEKWTIEAYCTFELVSSFIQKKNFNSVDLWPFGVLSTSVVGTGYFLPTFLKCLISIINKYIFNKN